MRAKNIFLLSIVAVLFAGLLRFLPGGSHAQPEAVRFEGIPTDRLAVWQPGLNPAGGIPHRTVVCATVNADAYGNGARNAATAIQAAINRCPEGQVVELSAGEFRIDARVFVNKSITLRGRGPALTRLKMPPGKEDNLITIGPVQWSTPSRTVDLAMDAIKGSRSVKLAKKLSVAAGELVIVDQLTEEGLNFWGHQCGPSEACRTWFTRPNRPVGQVLEVASVSGDTITFTTPLHVTFKVLQAAQLSRMIDTSSDQVIPVLRYAGVEDLHLIGGGQGNIMMAATAYSWIKGIESSDHVGSSVVLSTTFRSVVRDSYIHSARHSVPGGGAYGIAISAYSADNLVENNIVWRMNKLMVMQAAGGGNVIGYNYMEDGLIEYDLGWTESGLSASHMAGTHFALFEGNQSFNYDAENVWGSPIYITVFRNHLTSKRRSALPLKLPPDRFRRAVSLWEGAWWHTIVGNVLGYEGLDARNEDRSPLWVIGIGKNWGPPDPKVSSTLVRGGNYDYVTKKVHWENLVEQELPKSLYLTSKPEFFGSLEWPWVDPVGSRKLHTLPARARFDAGLPFAAPTGGAVPSR